MKRCPKCGEHKPAEAFGKSASTKDGLQSQCKACGAAYRAANSDKLRARKKAYYAANKGQLREKRKEYLAKNRKKTTETLKKYYAANKETIEQQKEEWRRRNPEKVKSYQRAGRVKLSDHYIKQQLTQRSPPARRRHPRLADRRQTRPTATETRATQMSDIITTPTSLQQLADVQADMAEVRSGMMKVFRDIKAGTTNRKDADAIANAAGKVIGAAKTELASIALSKAIQDNARIINPSAEQPDPAALPA